MITLNNEEWLELKDKADKYQLIIEAEPHGSAIETLAAQVRSLQDELDKQSSWATEMYNQAKKNKEIVSKIRKILDELERTQYGYWTLELLDEKLKEILGDKS